MGTGEIARPIASGPHANQLEATSAALLELNSVSKEQLLTFVGRLPSDQLRKSSEPRAGSVSFSTGAFVHAHVPGLRHNTRVFPNFTKLLCRYVKQTCPALSFTALVILHNLLSRFFTETSTTCLVLRTVFFLFQTLVGGSFGFSPRTGPLNNR